MAGGVFREELFFEDAEKLHLTFDESWVYSQIPDGEVRERLGEILAYDSAFSAVLDEICSNVVGRTLFRLLSTKAAMAGKGQRLRLANRGDIAGSYYSRRDFAVLTNCGLFDGAGLARDGSCYYCLAEEGGIGSKPATFTATLFHEFCHALHDLEKISEITVAGELHRSNRILGRTWDNAEELRTITGCIYGVAQDPICDHCLDLNLALARGLPFLPRYSHKGFDAKTPPRDEEMGRRELLSYLSESRKILDGWKRYAW
ncbi:MAG: hypothetical protein LBT98_00550 [Puniceicoccales bacterium]|jgi:hypothetical protein|nr:hypothetical protein [Puniceicoccales bacterium]